MPRAVCEIVLADALAAKNGRLNSDSFISQPYLLAHETIYGDLLLYGSLLHGITGIANCAADNIVGTSRPAPNPSEWMQPPLWRP